MYLERLLQINMATLAALGAMLLGMGERSEGPPLLVALAAALSVWLTDVTGRIRLGRRTSNLLMLLAAIVALWDVFPLGGELQTFGFARLSICLQIILLFQKKDEKVYWLLVMLSLLQVVVATLFSQGLWFGLLLAFYMLLGFLAMTLLMMHRQWERRDKPVGAPAVVDADRHELAVGKRRWPLAARGAEFTCQPGGSRRAGLDGDLYRLLGRMGLQTVGLAMVLFFAVPRIGNVGWRGAMAQPKTLVGFNDKVALGALGEIIESREEAMRVRFLRASDDATVRVHGDVYLQGAYLMRYENGQWRAGQPSQEIGSQQLQRADRFPPLWEIVKQKITIEGMDRNELFCVAPFFALKDNIEIDVDFPQQRLYRPDYRRRTRFNYTLATTAIVDGRQRPLVPARPDTRNPGWPDDLYDDTIAMPSKNGKPALPSLIALADRWIKESKLPRSNRAGRARYLTQKLSSSPFGYNLSGARRDPKLDPIEDFVTKHPQGHCEYFATALTLMLRSQGIAARMVSGYKCNDEDWNNLGGYYQVRQLHAHTWVEAYLHPSQLPRELIHGKNYWKWQLGGWLRLDPTPVEASARGGWLAPVRSKLDWLDSAWSTYVVELDCQRQRDAIYQPILMGLRTAWREATSAERWRAIWNSFAVAFYLDRLSRETRWLLAAVVGVLAAASLAFAGWFLCRVVRRWASGAWGRRSQRGERRTEVEFYRRFEAVLARRGLVRAPAQTQREFAAAAGVRLVALAGENRPASLAEVVTDAFYRVRFGRLPLDNRQAEAVEHALAELASLGRRPASPQ